MKAKEPRAELFLEIGCEKIPAGMIAKAASELKVTLEKYLAAESLITGGDVEAFGAPRRLVASARAFCGSSPIYRRKFPALQNLSDMTMSAGRQRPLRVLRQSTASPWPSFTW